MVHRIIPTPFIVQCGSPPWTTTITSSPLVLRRGEIFYKVDTGVHDVNRRTVGIDQVWHGTKLTPSPDSAQVTVNTRLGFHIGGLACASRDKISHPTFPADAIEMNFILILIFILKIRKPINRLKT
jgi:hypothetical protein